MSHDLYTYGTTDRIYFKVTLSAVGVTGLTFQPADIKLSKTGAAFVNIGTNCGEVGNGVYYWQPAAATDTQTQVIIINIKDDVGTEFDENCLIIATGGNASARFSG